MSLYVFVNEREKAREGEGKGREERWENSISVGMHIKFLLNSFSLSMKENYLII